MEETNIEPEMVAADNRMEIEPEQPQETNVETQAEEMIAPHKTPVREEGEEMTAARGTTSKQASHAKKASAMKEDTQEKENVNENVNDDFLNSEDYEPEKVKKVKSSTKSNTGSVKSKGFATEQTMENQAI